MQAIVQEMISKNDYLQNLKGCNVENSGYIQIDQLSEGDVKKRSKISRMKVQYAVFLPNTLRYLFIAPLKQPKLEFDTSNSRFLIFTFQLQLSIFRKWMGSFAFVRMNQSIFRKFRISY